MKGNIRNKMAKAIMLAAVSLCSSTIHAGEDWANFGRYEDSNKEVKSRYESERPKAVLMGNSITEGWAAQAPEFFTSNDFIGRGISGQTSYQMLLRFRDDVINLHPEIVVINAGTNDIAENNHQYDEQRTLGNIISMAELAKIHGIKVVLTSVLPTEGFYWNKSITEVPTKVTNLNKLIEVYAAAEGLPFIDYYGSMADERGALRQELTKDGVHPNSKGYEIMESVLMEKLKEI